MKKKFLTITLTVICMLALSACFNFGSGEQDKTPEEQQPFTVTFETNGGTLIEPISRTGRATLKNILGGVATTKQGKIFAGWFSDEELTNEVLLTDYIAGDCTLYAAWRDLTYSEILQEAIEYAYKNAVAATDVGFARTGISNFAASTVEATFTLKAGEVTSAHSGTRFYDGEFVYRQTDNVKLTLNAPSEAYVFLYHNELFKSLNFFQAFSPLCVARLADSGAYPTTQAENVITVEYTGSYSNVEVYWSKFDNPNVYFDGGKRFDFTLDGDRLLSVRQSGSKPRTITFYYEGDELPEVAQPQDKDSYEQKWQLLVDVGGGGTRVLYKSNINKEELDKEIFGERYESQTSKLTYYENEGMTKPIKFVGGVAPLSEHTTIYHPGIDYSI